MPKRKSKNAIASLLKQIHEDEEGSVSIETVLVIAAVALPILIFILKFGWPRVMGFFNSGMDQLEGTTDGMMDEGMP